MTSADNPQGTKFWLELKCFTTLITHFKFQPLVFNTLWENDFSTVTPYKCMGRQIWPCRKKGQRSTYSHHLNKLGRPSQCYIPIFSPKAFLVLKKIFNCFYHIWARRPSCSVARNHLNKLAISIRQKVHVKSGEKCSNGFKEEDI